MEGLPEHDRKVRREHTKFIRGKSKAANEQAGKIIREYTRGITANRDPEEVKYELMERFEVGPRRLQNIIERHGNYGNPALTAYTDAQMLVWLDRVSSDVSDIREECNTQLDKLDGLGSDEWVGIEQTDGTGKDASGTTTKKKPVPEVKIALLERKANALDRMFSAVKAIRGNNINILQIGGLGGMSLEDLQRQIDELEKHKKVNVEPISAA